MFLRFARFIQKIQHGEQWLVDDQRVFASRTGCFNFRFKPLKEKITISGEVFAGLVASTTGTDADWVVKLIDVYPEEYRASAGPGRLSADDFCRYHAGRYRENREQGNTDRRPEQAFTYQVRMPHANHAFLPGHRIMVQIQSSWFPLYDRNPQTFVPNIFEAPRNFLQVRYSPDLSFIGTGKLYRTPCATLTPAEDGFFLPLSTRSTMRGNKRNEITTNPRGSPLNALAFHEGL